MKQLSIEEIIKMANELPFMEYDITDAKIIIK